MAMPFGNVVSHGEKMQFAGDEFLSWLRSEFVAANAIIDSLCHRLRVVGEPGEYDLVVNCIRQRRCNWNSVLHLQQYFSVGGVTVALQQVAWRRQQEYFDHQVNRSKRSSYVKKDVHNLNVDIHGFDSNSSALDTKPVEDKKENDSHSVQNQNEKQNLTTAPKTFVGSEVLDGKMVNVVDGLKLYEKVCGNSEVSKLVSLVNELRAAGKRGQIQC